MFGRETFIVRVAEDAMAPRVRVGDYVGGGGEGTDPTAAGSQRSTTRSCSPIDYQPWERDSSPDGS